MVEGRRRSTGSQLRVTSSTVLDHAAAVMVVRPRALIFTLERSSSMFAELGMATSSSRLRAEAIVRDRLVSFVLDSMHSYQVKARAVPLLLEPRLCWRPIRAMRCIH